MQVNKLTQKTKHIDQGNPDLVTARSTKIFFRYTDIAQKTFRTGNVRHFENKGIEFRTNTHMTIMCRNDELSWTIS